MTSKICSSCKYLLTPSEAFCPECGTKYTEPEAQSSMSSSQTEASVPANTPSPSQSTPPDQFLNQQPIDGQFLYKAVTFDSYMMEVMGDRRKDFAFDLRSMTNSYAASANYLNKKIIGLVDDMFNYYGKQGWEYWNKIDVPIERIMEMAEISGNSKSVTSFLAAGLKSAIKGSSVDGFMPSVLTHYIFRKATPK